MQQPYEQPSAAVEDYRQQSRYFLEKSRQYLAEDDLHQASEKGWGAAAWMAKAVAERQSWQYRKHDEFFDVMLRVERAIGEPDIGALKSEANTLHTYFYMRKMFLDADDISRRLDRMQVLLDLLEPLTRLP